MINLTVILFFVIQKSKNIWSWLQTNKANMCVKNFLPLSMIISKHYNQSSNDFVKYLSINITK